MMITAFRRSTSGFHPQIRPSKVSKMSRAGRDLPFFEITKSEVVLMTSPVGEPGVPGGWLDAAGTVTVNGSGWPLDR
jgi:hypothetical protein